MSDPQPEISRYFYDLEFLETGETIDPISIGIVRAEDGAGYYAVNADVDWNGVLDHRWLPTNVVPHLPTKRLRSGRLVLDGDHPDVKPHGQIAEEVLAFLRGGHPTIELWASYGAFDHVALAWMWGPMGSMPTGIPYFTRDIQDFRARLGNPDLPPQDALEHHALADAQYNLLCWRYLTDLERQREVVETARRRRATAEVFRRANVTIEDDDALDRELLEIANRAGSSLVRVHLHDGPPPYAAVESTLTLVAALRELLGYSGTPVATEVLSDAMASSRERPEVCPDCQEVGLCDHDCATALAKGWARETAPATSNAWFDPTAPAPTPPESLV